MPNEPISQLTQTYSPSATDVVPIVSQGTTQKVSITTLVSAASANIMGEPFFYASGQYLNSKGSFSNVITVANTLYVYPLILGQPVSISAIAVDVTTAAASSTIQLGIYSSTYFGNMPNTLIAGTTCTVAGSAIATPTYTYGSNIVLPADIYWLAVVAQGGTPTLQQISTPNMWTLPTSAPSTSAVLGYTMTGVSSALPSTYTITTSTANVPRVWLKLV